MASSSFDIASLSSVGGLLRYYREQSGLKQRDLEQYGVDQSTISRLENGKLNPSAETLRQLASAFKIDYEDLRRKVDSFPKVSSGDAELSLGMLHGIACAPLITMLLDRELRCIRSASTKGENGLLNWWEPGKQPDTTRLGQESNAQALFAGSLEKLLSDVGLDLIVASEEMFRDETGPGGRLLRCAQISNSYSMIHLLKFRPKHLETASTPSKPVMLFYPHGTIGVRYKDILINESQLKGKVDPQYYTLDQPHNELPEAIQSSFKGQDPFYVLTWPPRSSSLKKNARERKYWHAEPVDIARLLDHYSARVPVCSVDLLLNVQSDRTVEWLQSGEYVKFFDDLIRHTRSFSADRLRQDSRAVDQVSKYLGIDDPKECFQELLLIDYNVMFYPEFLRFLDDVRDKRAK